MVIAALVRATHVIRGGDVRVKDLVEARCAMILSWIQAKCQFSESVVQPSRVILLYL